MGSNASCAAQLLPTTLRPPGMQAIRQERAALVLQTAWRGAVVRREYVGVLAYWRAAVKIQAAWRAHSARQLYVQVRLHTVTPLSLDSCHPALCS